MISRWIEEDYQEAIRFLPEIPDELRKALKAHERIPKFFEGLQKEFIKIEQRNITMTRADIKKIVYDLTLVFVSNLKRLADERSMSELRRISIQQEAQRVKELDDTADGKPSGEYTEMIGRDEKCR